MRLQINLNRHYRGLEDHRVARLFRRMTNAGPAVSDVKLLLKDGVSKDRLDYRLARSNMVGIFLDIDLLMESWGKPRIFGIKRRKEQAGGHLRNIDEIPLVEKYDYLMQYCE